jgi:hypothetical protein
MYLIHLKNASIFSINTENHLYKTIIHECDKFFLKIIKFTTQWKSTILIWKTSKILKMIHEANPDHSIFALIELAINVKNNCTYG